MFGLFAPNTSELVKPLQQTMEDPEYSENLGLSIILFLDLKRGRKIPNIWACSHDLMAKFATSAQEIPESLGQVLYHCALIEKVIKIFCSAFAAIL